MFILGTTAAGEFTLRDPSSAAASDASSTPSGTLVLNGVDTGVAVTITHKATGIYKWSAAISGSYSRGDRVQIRITATVGGVTDSSDVADDVCEIATATLVSSITTGFSGVTITYSSPSLVQTVIDPPVIRHRDYFADDGRSIDISITGGPNISGASSVKLMAVAKDRSGNEFAWTGSVLSAGGPTQTVRFEPTKTQTASPEGQYEAQVVITLADGHVVSPCGIFILPMVGKDDVA